MSNIIEFRAKNKNSKSFLVGTCGLKVGQRLLEVDVISSLTRSFGVSAQIAAAVYQRAAKGGNVTVDDLGSTID
jgi:hypothetical protein